MSLKTRKPKQKQASMVLADSSSWKDELLEQQHATDLILASIDTRLEELIKKLSPVQSSPSPPQSRNFNNENAQIFWLCTTKFACRDECGDYLATGDEMIFRPATKTVYSIANGRANAIPYRRGPSAQGLIGY